MFDKYEIKYENNEEVLYLYVSNDYEFGSSFFTNNNFKNFFKSINFKGNMVKIIVSGMVISTLFLNNISPSINNQIDTSLNTVLINELKEEANVVQSQEKEENKNETILSDQNAITSINNNEVSTPKANNSTNNSTNNKSQNTTTNTTPKVEESNNKSEVVDNNIYVMVIRNSGTVKIELEEYLIGVVGAEMPASFNVEALKAQAVVARTYTLKKISQGLSIRDSVSDQVYKNNEELKSMWGSSYNTYYNKIKNAVESTKGEYIVYNGSYIEAVYHSTSNGYTESSKEVWGNSYSYLVSVESVWDKSASTYLKTEFFSYEKISNILGINVNKDTVVEILSRNSSNRVSTLRIENNYYTGVEFRNKVGLRSADFVIEKTDSGLSITTYGYGHGVGMSQYGANGMAKEGYSYKQIITYYYKGVSISKG